MDGIGQALRRRVPDRAQAMEFGLRPAADAPDHGGRGLDDKLPLAAHDFRGEDLQAL
jgi:hypothetical protein